MINREIFQNTVKPGTHLVLSSINVTEANAAADAIRVFKGYSDCPWECPGCKGRIVFSDEKSGFCRTNDSDEVYFDIVIVPSLEEELFEI